MTFSLKKIYNHYQETILYLFFGGATTVVSIITYFIFSSLVHFNYSLSYVLSWLISVLFAYLTNRIWVFHSKVNDLLGLFREIWQFYLARILTGIIGWVIMAFGVSILHQNDLLWNVIQNIFVIVSNYVLSKLFIFKKTEYS
ncbi:Putative flippase GtrA (transmembrane translocase of bactoprenol-linked glucose) (GtrA) [Fructobacillus tropaeoli]|uniref:Flippase GtrA (Transmembrane translocase of bactoprenol-linked glucose) (GtrA) n=1 Tax=Fructobacillus tropaeoli TaxID=709323 RepID=A0ABM9MR32_9LACO|nr:GtrA family protein [Fructobacillus tropaeoli]NLS37570.1 GtrA family protein [Fructobacillus tropaeoli]CAK1226429.1 Putative flippase GtrA (transmembrane translocase of bactoprenol-linked glucose) (GtrA) [Fructobacillus tropaeoli]CAK1233944.1 Putative flippase GtrA (transmembrane translocase of bactoprenol-linked glucose) (GtrA) [Fructobacillus tropaeoli]CAK1236171.1 Putative flippase GtrA (transmembrane translocase of bactoprenol-linked glucose) (GtrA) [Fructobacillus tropaeoli]CAK1250439.